MFVCLVVFGLWILLVFKTEKERRKSVFLLSCQEEKYLADQIHTNGSDASILSTVNKSISKSICKLNEIIGLAENP